MALRIPSGVTDQYGYFTVIDVDDYVTRLTGQSGFTIYRSRNGGAATAMTTPTTAELDATNMPGRYSLLLDEDMTIDSGDDSQWMTFTVTKSGIVPYDIDIELYRPKITAGETLTVASGVGSANATQISGDSTAADNLEAILDGTGGVTLVASAFTLTTPITANATQLSGDSTAADNAESFFDGTGYAGTNNVIPLVTTTTTATNVTTVNGLAANVITATSIQNDAITAAKIANSAIDAATFAADVDAEILSYIVDDATRIDASSLNTATVTTVPAILVDTAEIGAAGAGLTDLGGMSTTMKGQVQTEANDALVANNLDHLLLSAVDTDFATTVHLNSVIGHLADNGTAATFDRTTDSLEALNGLTVTVGAVADAVWDESTTSHTTSGTFGEQCKTDIDAILVDTAEIGAAGAGLTDLGGMSTTMKAQVQTEANDALVANNLDHLVLSAVDTDFATTVHLNSVMGYIADNGTTATFDRTTDSLEALNGLTVTAAAIADAVWDEATTSHTTSGTFGEQVKTDIDAILADTGTDGVAIADGYITAAKIATDAITAAKIADGAIDSATFATGAITAASIAADAITAAKIATGAIDADALAADAANEIADALLDRTDGVETNITVRKALRATIAALVGKLSGAATSTVTIRDTADTTNRVVATVDSSGNRSAVTLTLT